MDCDWPAIAALANDLDAVAGDGTAAAYWSLPAPRRERPTLVIGRDRSRVRSEVADIRRRTLVTGDWCVANGVPVTTPLRTAVDLARVLPYEQGVAVADSLLNQRLVGEDEFARAALRVMGPGSPAVRRAFSHADGRAASPPETLLRLWFTECPELGPVVPQFRLADDGHPYDIGLPWWRTVVEYQSWASHGARSTWVRDARWGNEAAAAGFRYLQVVHEDMLLGREHVLALVTC